MWVQASAIACAALLFATQGEVGAQQRPQQSQRPLLPLAAPSRADSMLAVGRLAAAEEELYAAVGAEPRSPTARGALGDYLASRGRFRIAEILFEEAKRFGADGGAVRRAIQRMAPYRRPIVGEAEMVVYLVPVSDPAQLGVIGIGTAPSNDGAPLPQRAEARATIDLRVTGLRVGSSATVARGPDPERPWRVDVVIGGLRIRGVDVVEDSTLAPDAVLMGLDVLWGLQVRVDERAGALAITTIARDSTRRGRVEHIPTLLTFPGVSLVPRVGSAPVPLGSAAGRALVRGTRWQISEATSTVIVER